jgi:heptosyltransferase-2
LSAREIPVRGPDSAHEILVRGPNWTGDLIMATPGFRALRAGFPDARITLLVRASLAELVAGAPWFDAVWPLRSHQGGLAALLREGRALRRHARFDLGVCLPDSFESALLMRLAGVRRCVGYARGGRDALLHQAVPLPREAGRRMPFGRGRRVLLARELHVLGLLEALGCAPRGTALELFVTEAEEQAAQAALRERGVPRGAEIALLAPGASFGASKLWPAESFAAVGDALAAQGAEVVVIGAPGERALAARVCAAMRAKAFDLAGALGLGGLKALVRGARLLVANDAGARHLAVAFGVPCVVMMGPTALEKTNLNLERVSVLTAGVACRPCYLRDCPIDHRCMTRIPPALVAAEGKRALAAGVRYEGVQRVVGGLAA